MCFLSVTDLCGLHEAHVVWTEDVATSYDHGDASGQAGSGCLCGSTPANPSWSRALPDGLDRFGGGPSAGRSLSRRAGPPGQTVIGGDRGWLGIRVPGQILSSIQRLIARDVIRSTDSRPNQHLPDAAERPELIVQSAWIDPRLFVLRRPQREGGHCAS